MGDCLAKPSRLLHGRALIGDVVVALAGLRRFSSGTLMLLTGAASQAQPSCSGTPSHRPNAPPASTLAQVPSTASGQGGGGCCSLKNAGNNNKKGGGLLFSQEGGNNKGGRGGVVVPIRRGEQQGGGVVVRRNRGVLLLLRRLLLLLLLLLRVFAKIQEGESHMQTR